MSVTKYIILLLFSLAVVSAGCESSDPHPTPTPGAGNVASNTIEAEADTAKAVDLIKHDSYDKARDILLRAISADPMYGPAHNDLGLVYFHFDEIYSAAIEYRDAIKLMPRQAQPLNNLGLTLESAGKYREAEQYYSQAVSIDPDNMEYVGNLARVKVRLGETDKTLTDLLARVVLYDNRPHWSQWAQRMLAHEPRPTTLPLQLP